MSVAHSYDRHNKPFYGTFQPPDARSFACPRDIVGPLPTSQMQRFLPTCIDRLGTPQYGPLCHWSLVSLDP